MTWRANDQIRIRWMRRFGIVGSWETERWRHLPSGYSVAAATSWVNHGGYSSAAGHSVIDANADASSSEGLTDASASSKTAAPPDALLISRSIHALARRRSTNEGAWRAHLSRAEAACGRAGAEAVARVLNACARSPVDANRIANLYVDRAKRLLPQCNTRDLSMVAGSAARLTIRDEAFLAAFARELRGKFAKCNVREASSIANAYAKQFVAERVLFGQLIPAYVASNARRFRVQDLAQVLNAYAKVQMRSVAVFEALADRCCDQAPHMDCHAVSVIVNAHARLAVANERLFGVLAERLRACARTCTLQAVSNILNAYARFDFGGASGVDSGNGFTQSVFDCMVGELPRTSADMAAQSLCVIAHAAARVQQHRRRPELAATLAEHALSLDLNSLEPSQRAMLAVAFAEMFPMISSDGSSASVDAAGVTAATSVKVRFWAALADAVSADSASGESATSAADAANCAVAFAAARLGSEEMARIRLSRFCKEEPPPSVAAAIFVAHALTRLWDGVALPALGRHVPGMLWQASDAVACRLALSMWLTLGYVARELHEAVLAHIVRVGAAVDGVASASEAASDEPPSAASARTNTLLAACQGFAAVMAPALHGGRGDRRKSRTTRIGGSGSAITDIASSGGQLQCALDDFPTMWFKITVKKQSEKANAQLVYEDGTSVGAAALGTVSLQQVSFPVLSPTCASAEVFAAGSRFATWLDRQDHFGHKGHAELVRCLVAAAYERDVDEVNFGGDPELQPVPSPVEPELPVVLRTTAAIRRRRAAVANAFRNACVAAGEEVGTAVRVPELCGLLMPSVSQRSAPPDDGPRQLARTLRQQGCKPLLHYRAKNALIVDVAMLFEVGRGVNGLTVANGNSEPGHGSVVPIAFVVDGDDDHLRVAAASEERHRDLASESSRQSVQESIPDSMSLPSQRRRLAPEAALRGYLLAAQGWLVIRVGIGELRQLRASQHGGRELLRVVSEQSAIVAARDVVAATAVK